MSASDETVGPHGPHLPETALGSKVDSQESHDLAAKTVESQASERPESAGLASYREFARTLIEIGLIEAVELGKIAVQSPKEVLGLSRALVKAGKLTPYQAAAVYQKKSRGLLIGDYLILDKVGQGGMGKVFKARHRKLGRLGALKILPPSFARDRDAVTRFRREFEAAGRLKHINLVAAFEANEDRGVHFLVMEYVEGMNLDRVVSEQGPLAIPRGVDYLIQAARGLEASHGMGIIHRDIKPGNLMLDHGGTVRVLDLGLARIVDANNPFSKTSTGRLTQSGMYMGTIDYMAPEQAEDPHSVDHRADIYSLGCTLYFLLTGRVPFPGKTILKRMLAHQEHAAPLLRAIRSEVSPALESAYLNMMAKRPEARPASMADVIALLQSSKLATDTGMGKVAPAHERAPSPKACHETPQKRASLPPPPIDSAIFARGAEGDGMLVDRVLNLRDLVMDVLPEVQMTGDDCAAHDELDDIFSDHELNLRELAMELREEAAPLAAPKPQPPRY
jgi:serine/threonine protein kinase